MSSTTNSSAVTSSPRLISKPAELNSLAIASPSNTPPSMSPRESRLASFPDYIAPMSPVQLNRINNHFPPLDPSKQYKGVYERCGFDILKSNNSNNNSANSSANGSATNLNNLDNPTGSENIDSMFSQPPSVSGKSLKGRSPSLPNLKHQNSNSSLHSNNKNIGLVTSPPNPTYNTTKRKNSFSSFSESTPQQQSFSNSEDNDIKSNRSSLRLAFMKPFGTIRRKVSTGSISSNKSNSSALPSPNSPNVQSQNTESSLSIIVPPSAQAAAAAAAQVAQHSSLPVSSVTSPLRESSTPTTQSIASRHKSVSKKKIFASNKPQSNLSSNATSATTVNNERNSGHSTGSNTSESNNTTVSSTNDPEFHGNIYSSASTSGLTSSFSPTPNSSSTNVKNSENASGSHSAMVDSYNAFTQAFNKQNGSSTNTTNEDKSNSQNLSKSNSVVYNGYFSKRTNSVTNSSNNTIDNSSTQNTPKAATIKEDQDDDLFIDDDYDTSTAIENNILNDSSHATFLNQFQDDEKYLNDNDDASFGDESILDINQSPEKSYLQKSSSKEQQEEERNDDYRGISDAYYGRDDDTSIADDDSIFNDITRMDSTMGGRFASRSMRRKSKRHSSKKSSINDSTSSIKRNHSNSENGNRSISSIGNMLVNSPPLPSTHSKSTSVAKSSANTNNNSQEQFVSIIQDPQNNEISNFENSNTDAIDSNLEPSKPEILQAFNDENEGPTRSKTLIEKNKDRLMRKLTKKLQRLSGQFGVDEASATSDGNALPITPTSASTIIPDEYLSNKNRNEKVAAVNKNKNISKKADISQDFNDPDNISITDVDIAEINGDLIMNLSSKRIDIDGNSEGKGNSKIDKKNANDTLLKVNASKKKHASIASSIYSVDDMEDGGSEAEDMVEGDNTNSNVGSGGDEDNTTNSTVVIRNDEEHKNDQDDLESSMNLLSDLKNIVSGKTNNASSSATKSHKPPSVPLPVAPITPTEISFTAVGPSSVTSAAPQQSSASVSNSNVSLPKTSSRMSGISANVTPSTNYGISRPGSRKNSDFSSSTDSRKNSDLSSLKSAGNPISNNNSSESRSNSVGSSSLLGMVPQMGITAHITPPSNSGYKANTTPPTTRKASVPQTLRHVENLQHQQQRESVSSGGISASASSTSFNFSNDDAISINKKNKNGNIAHSGSYRTVNHAVSRNDSFENNYDEDEFSETFDDHEEEEEEDESHHPGTEKNKNSESSMKSDNFIDKQGATIEDSDILPLNHKKKINKALNSLTDVSDMPDSPQPAFNNGSPGIQSVADFVSGNPNNSISSRIQAGRVELKDISEIQNSNTKAEEKKNEDTAVSPYSESVFATPVLNSTSNFDKLRGSSPASTVTGTPIGANHDVDYVDPLYIPKKKVAANKVDQNKSNDSWKPQTIDKKKGFESEKEEEFKYPSGEGPCRKCYKEITSKQKTVWSKDKQMSGRWHRSCFSCYRCNEFFKKGANCYVLNDNPYCHYDFHYLNQSLCKICNNGIEGKCLENNNHERFHPDCLKCVKCGVLIVNDYFVLDNKPLCENDGLKEIELEAQQVAAAANGGGYSTEGDQTNLEDTDGLKVTSKVEKRRTFLFDLAETPIIT